MKERQQLQFLISIFVDLDHLQVPTRLLSKCLVIWLHLFNIACRRWYKFVNTMMYKIIVML